MPERVQVSRVVVTAPQASTQTAAPVLAGLQRSAQYTVSVRDADLNTVGQVDGYAQLSMTRRFNAVGTWEMIVPADHAMLPLLLANRAGIVVQRDNQIIFSGPRRRQVRQWDGNTDTVMVGGPDDLVWLRDALAYPDPANIAPPYSVEADIRGPAAAGTVIGQYVAANIGPTAPFARRLAFNNLTINTTAVGLTVKGRSRFASLLDLCRELAVSGGDIGFQMLQTANALTFTPYQPVDRTGYLRFSRTLGNLAGYTYSQETPTANTVIMGGGGASTARTFLIATANASVTQYGRIETFRDRRDTTDSTELQQSADDELDQGAAPTRLSIQPIDTPTIQYGRDYVIGDRVTIEIDSVMIQDSVREVTFNLTEAGEEITPLIGTPGQQGGGLLPAEFVRLFAQLRRLGTRTDALERRV